MATGLSEHSFATLLARLDPDRTRAGERYEDLRRTLVRFFEWRGGPFPEEHADETFDRVARRLSEGIDVKNIGGYCYNVGRLVLMEALKGPDRRRAPLDAIDPRAVDGTAAQLDRESRFTCLDACLAALPAEGRDLIVMYYADDRAARIAGRRAMAERLGIRPEALANRAQRLRDKLEACVS